MSKAHDGPKTTAFEGIEEFVGILRGFTRTKKGLLVRLELGPVTIRAHPQVLRSLQQRLRRLVGEPVGILRVVDEDTGEAVWWLRGFHK